MHAVYEPPLWITQETSRANPDFHHGLLGSALSTLPREERSDPEAPRPTCAEYRMNSRCHDLLRAKKVVQKNLARYTDSCGSHVRSSRRQSMPSSSIDNCARVSETVPLVACGQTKRPRSSRLANRHNPSPSYQRTLIRSPRRPRNTNTCPENGFCSSLVSTSALSPVKPRRKSVTPAAIQIR